MEKRVRFAVLEADDSDGEADTLMGSPMEVAPPLPAEELSLLPMGPLRPEFPVSSNAMDTGPPIPTSPIGFVQVDLSPIPSSPTGVMEAAPAPAVKRPARNVPTGPVSVSVDLPEGLPVAASSTAVFSFGPINSAPRTDGYASPAASGLFAGDRTAQVPALTARVPDTTARVPDTTARVPDTTARVPDTTARVPDTTAPPRRSTRRLHKPSARGAAAPGTPSTMDGALPEASSSNLRLAPTRSSSQHAPSSGPRAAGTQSATQHGPSTRPLLSESAHSDERDTKLRRRTAFTDPTMREDAVLRMAEDISHFGAEHIAYLRTERAAWGDVATAAAKLQETISLKDISEWGKYNECLCDVGEEWYPTE
ncbi:hypothetical protein OH76DRAFT_1491011 [Lentinus brumalis]|uniref:Uncharacterized protein n=1 Tax=Lentinus brumalis TaxID=2498619 RepID=A0A371CH38_9APHY|nr:hypothetical protein OH76DRAFT_1491011 [Polyporus brumalis]